MVPPKSGLGELRGRLIVSQAMLIELLEEIKPAVRSYPSVKHKVAALLNYAVSHFRLQSDEVYAELIRLGQDKGASLKVIEFLKEDLKEIKVKVFVFSEKYSDEQFSRPAKGFGRDFTELYEALNGRILIEKNQLLPLLA